MRLASLQRLIPHPERFFDCFGSYAREGIRR